MLSFMLVSCIYVGTAAIIPVEGSVVTVAGDSTQLAVYVAGLAGDEVQWRDPSGHLISSGSRVSLHDDNTQLVLQSVELGDSGLYGVSVVRLGSGVNTTVVSTNIDLNVQGENSYGI